MSTGYTMPKIKMTKALEFASLSIVIIILVLVVRPFYILNEGQTAIITKFGEIVKTETVAGIHFKIPILNQVHKYTAKLQRIDGDPQKFPQKKNNFLRLIRPAGGVSRTYGSFISRSLPMRRHIRGCPILSIHRYAT